MLLQLKEGRKVEREAENEMFALCKMLEQRAPPTVTATTGVAMLLGALLAGFTTEGDFDVALANFAHVARLYASGIFEHRRSKPTMQ